MSFQTIIGNYRNWNNGIGEGFRTNQAAAFNPACGISSTTTIVQKTIISNKTSNNRNNVPSTTKPPHQADTFIYFIYFHLILVLYSFIDIYILQLIHPKLYTGYRS